MKNKLLLFFLISFLWFQYSYGQNSCTSNNVNVSKLELIQNPDNTFNVIITFSTLTASVKEIKLDIIVDGVFIRIGPDCKVLNPPPTVNQPYLLFENITLNNLPVSETNIIVRTTFDTSGGCNFNDAAQCKDNQIRIIILPVIWHNFSATLQAGSRSIALNWSTLKEWESSHFEIERSENGIASFEKIGEEKSVGWSDTETNYQFLDRYLPLDHSRLYYRIKQVDFDGTTDYSATRMVESPKSHLKIGWQAYPNPTQNHSLFLRSTVLFRNRENPITVKISSIDSGQSVTFQTYEAELDLSNYIKNFPKGLLVIEIINPDSVELLKVVHQ